MIASASEFIFMQAARPNVSGSVGAMMSILPWVHRAKSWAAGLKRSPIGSFVIRMILPSKASASVRMAFSSGEIKAIQAHLRLPPYGAIAHDLPLSQRSYQLDALPPVL